MAHLFATARPQELLRDGATSALPKKVGSAEHLHRHCHRTPSIRPQSSPPRSRLRACYVQHILQNGAWRVQALDRRDDAPFNAISWPTGREDSSGSSTATDARTVRAGRARPSSARPAAGSSEITSARSRPAGSQTRASRSFSRSRAPWASPSTFGQRTILHPSLARPRVRKATPATTPSHPIGGRRSLRQNLPRPRPATSGGRASKKHARPLYPRPRPTDGPYGAGVAPGGTPSSAPEATAPEPTARRRPSRAGKPGTPRRASRQMKGAAP